MRPLLLLLAASVPLHAADPKDDVFAAAKVLPVHVTIAAKEFEAMQPRPAGGGFFGPAPLPARKPGDREIHRNAFNVDLPWAVGSVTADGTTVEKVGVRYKGNGTILDAGNTIKKSLKLDLDRIDPAGRFRGQKTLNLHSGVADPSKARETLAYSAYRAVGVPAPRTTFADVTLTVPGKYDREPLGLYTVVEPVDKRFLKAHFGDGDGLLFKPERLRGLDYLGDNWDRYKTTYTPKRDATPDEQRRLIAFAKLVQQADDAAFNQQIADYLDVDGFLRFTAATAFVVNLDSFFMLGHNYYLYLHPKTNRFHFLPWDADRAFANFGIFGSAEQQMDLSLAKPYFQNRLVDRVLAAPGVRDRYQQVLKQMAATLTRERLVKEVDAFEALTKDVRAKGDAAAKARKEPAAGTPFGPIPDLRVFAAKRGESVAAQLSGASQGYRPAMNFGQPPPAGNPLAKPLLDLLDTDKNGQVTATEFEAGMKALFKKWDKDGNGVLDQKEIADGLQKLGQPPMGGR